MTIGEFIRQGFHYALGCRALWLFGFFVGLSGGGSGGASGGRNSAQGGGLEAGAGPFHFTPDLIAPVILAVILLVIGAVVMRFISEGALIEGVARTRAGEHVSTGQGFRFGVRHFWVLVRIALVMAGVALVTILLPGLAILAIGRLAGWTLAIVLGIVAVLAAIPWLITLTLIQTFAARIAVLENRQAMDAIAKARLFLHGRIPHGLRVIVASLLAQLAVAAIGALVIIPAGLAVFLLGRAVGSPAPLVIACILALPLVFVGVAITGLVRSSIWTIGYLDQAPA